MVVDTHVSQLNLCGMVNGRDRRGAGFPGMAAFSTTTTSRPIPHK